MANSGSDSHCTIPKSREEQARVIEAWLVETQADLTKRKRVLRCLDKEHLYSLPRSRVLVLPEVFKATHWRILFYSNVAFILGWKGRRDFLDELFRVVRQIWPDEDEHHAPICERGGPTGDTREAVEPKSCMQETDPG